MKCPKCDAEMRKLSYRTIVVDRCTKCGGIWFDMLEAQHLKEIEVSDAVDTGDRKVGREDDTVGDIDCPKCRVKMIRMVDPQQPHIRFESCATCYGLFFDAGEFADFKEETVLDFFRDLFAKERK